MIGIGVTGQKNMESEFNTQAQKFFRESIDAYEAVLLKPDGTYPPYDIMITLRQLSACYLKVEAGDRIGNLRRALDCSMKALAIAQSLNDNYMEADLKGSLGSCAFALGIETGSMNLVHEAISYHMESAASYAQWQNYWQQQAMHYGYAAYCIENLPDGDSIHNAKRRVDLYERMLKCLPADVPESYVVDIAGRLTEARSILE